MQERNDLGLQLIERNEEVCVFYEKLNVHESIIREANLKFNAREEELKLLNVEVILCSGTAKIIQLPARPIVEPLLDPPLDCL